MDVFAHQWIITDADWFPLISQAGCAWRGRAGLPFIAIYTWWHLSSKSHNEILTQDLESWTPFQNSRTLLLDNAPPGPPQMSLNDPNWSHMIPYGIEGSQIIPNERKFMILIIPEDPKWAQMTPDDVGWLQRIADDRRWSHMVRDGARWSKMNPHNPGLPQIIQMVVRRWS